jgi:hypothetical protein
MFYFLLIVNKNGSLIYDKSISVNLQLNSNEVINMASIFYSMHAISSKLTPPGYEKTSELKLENNGIEIIESSAMKLVCKQTLTKIKFILVTDPTTSNDEIEKTFNKIYNLYSDTVSKNPFYDLDMPIRLDNFDIGINNIFKI